MKCDGCDHRRTESDSPKRSLNSAQVGRGKPSMHGRSTDSLVDQPQSGSRLAASPTCGESKEAGSIPDALNSENVKGDQSEHPMKTTIPNTIAPDPNMPRRAEIDGIIVYASNMIDACFAALRDETNRIIGEVLMLDGSPEWNTAEVF